MVENYTVSLPNLTWLICIRLTHIQLVISMHNLVAVHAQLGT
jgi:hypothetical protein